MDNFIVIAVVVLILGCAIAYIVKEKKKGVRCVGCPYAEKLIIMKDSQVLPLHFHL